MSEHILETEFRVMITELDAQMQLRGGYEDEHGVWVDTMSEEEFRAEYDRLEGHIRLRGHIVSGGKHIAFETPTAPATERAHLLFDLTRRLANMMLQWIKAEESTRKPQESESRTRGFESPKRADQS